MLRVIFTECRHNRGLGSSECRDLSTRRHRQALRLFQLCPSCFYGTCWGCRRSDACNFQRSEGQRWSSAFVHVLATSPVQRKCSRASSFVHVRIRPFVFQVTSSFRRSSALKPSEPVHAPRVVPRFLRTPHWCEGSGCNRVSHGLIVDEKKNRKLPIQGSQ